MAQAVSGSDEQPEDSHELVEFRLDDEVYVVGVDNVSGTHRMKDLTRVPRSAESISGITDVRGEITVVIDPRTLLGIDDDDRSDGRLLLLDDSLDNQKLALRVDSVIGVREYPDSQVETESDVRDLDLEGFESGLLKGVIRIDEDENEDDEQTSIEAPRLRGWVELSEVVEQSEVNLHDQQQAKE